MKPLTEAQLMGYCSAMVPPSRRYKIDREPTAAEKLAGKHKLATRRAIEEHHEQRAVRLAMEL